MKLNSITTKILEKRYLLKDDEGNVIETPEQMLLRVVDAVCFDDEDLKNKVFDLMNESKFLPNTPTLMNSGVNNMLSACFVVPIFDDLNDIVHNAGWYQAYIHKLGGGVGINFSNLRPKGDLIKTTGGITSGVLGFLKLFDCLSSVIHQGGKRNGANMGILHISHPEIEDFIVAKVNNKTDYNNFNLSVMVTNEFMNAVENDEDWDLVFNGKIYKTVKARDLFDSICKSAWECGCPGLLFEDIANESNVLDDIGMHMTCTNPCSEIWAFCGYYENELIAESCNLGSICLSHFVDNEGKIKWNELKNTVNVAVEFLDKVIDANKYPFDFIDKGTKMTRRIGLGVTGFSDMLIKMDIPYNSTLAVNTAELIMKFISTQATEMSVKLGRKGLYPLAEKVGDNKRNVATTVIAPTGTIGRLMLGHGYALGIEPPFALSMKSNILESSFDEGVHPLLVEKLKERNLEHLIETVHSDGSSIQHIDEIPDDIKKLFLTASEIPIEQHILIQSAFQKWTDNSVSKTVNMKSDASVSDVRNAFMIAYKLKCKGITVFRDMCKDEQVMVTNTKGEQGIVNELQPIQDLVPRPSVLPAINFVRRSGCNTMFITLTQMPEKDGVLECFIDTSGHGGCRAMQDGLAIAISVYQRYIEGVIGHEHAVNALNIVSDHLLNVTCPSSMISISKQKYEKSDSIVDSRSCPNAVGQVIKKMIKEVMMFDTDRYKNISNKLNDNQYSNIIDEFNVEKCIDCNIPLVRQGGCSSLQCPNCGKGGCY